MSQEQIMAAPRKENIKEVIINSTSELLKTKSLSEISLAEIAEKSEISKGTLYYYYKSKSEILLDITDKYLDEQWNDLIKWTENKEKDTSLQRLVKYVFERNTDSAGIRIHLINDAMLGDETVKNKLLQRYKDFEKLIADKISERTEIAPPDYITWLILLASDGLIIQKNLGNEIRLPQQYDA